MAVLGDRNWLVVGRHDGGVSILHAKPSGVRSPSRRTRRVRIPTGRRLACEVEGFVSPVFSDRLSVACYDSQTVLRRLGDRLTQRCKVTMAQSIYRLHQQVLVRDRELSCSCQISGASGLAVGDAYMVGCWDRAGLQTTVSGLSLPLV